MNEMDRERDKYRRMWARPEYRVSSPGETAVAKFASLVPREGTILDVGCGTGRAALVLEALGWDVAMNDLVWEAVDEEAKHIRFYEGPIHELTNMQFDWIYCVDMLEHVPPTLVETTLDAICDIACVGAFLQISCSPDGCGALIGETLHLTIRPPEWWYTQVTERWRVRADLSYDNYAIFLCER